MPTQVMQGSHKKFGGNAKKGHEWIAAINDRKETSCPYCSNKKLLAGYNDLATTNPKLAAEWNYEKNGNLMPAQVMQGSNKKVWWKCEKGHEWVATINSRKSRNCPHCSKRKTNFFSRTSNIFLSIKIHFKCKKSI
ncbi:MAG: zinc-ribbon domain-containing protein [Candidatus Melainabacteria bacterium]|nr:MAG: zinc-ribbon domain-containing protein [Candidatus Melainabacteria bacterium]